MDRSSIEHLLSTLGLRSKSKLEGRNGDEIVANCPLALYRHEKGQDKTPSFSIKISSIQSPCFCYGCGFTGSLWFLLKSLEELSGKSYENEINFVLEREGISEKKYISDKISYDLNISKKKVKFESVVFGEEECEVYRKMPINLGYLSKRNINYSSIINWDIFYDIYTKRIVFPIRNIFNELKGFTGRLSTDNCVFCNGNNFNDLLCIDCGIWKTPKWRHSKGLNKDEFLFGEDKIDQNNNIGYLVEGPIDVVRLHQNGIPNVVCALGSVLSEANIERLCQFFSVLIIIGDGDKAGRHMVKTVNDKLGKRIIIKYIDLPDGKDPGDLSDLEIINLIIGKEKPIFLGW